MPLKFDALKHPRDKRGRFTKSRTVLASAKDKKAVKEIAAGFKPDKTGDGKSYAAKIADPRQQKAASDFALDAKAVNEDLRAGHADAPGVKPMDDAMRPLPDDLILHRSVPATAFGSIDLQSLAGMKVRDAGYSPTQIDAPQPSDGDVHLFIAAPKGSRAVVNGETGEVYLDRDSEMVVSRVEKNSAGGHDMYMTVLPKTGSKDSSSKDASAKPVGKTTDRTAEKPKPADAPAKAAPESRAKVPAKAEPKPSPPAKPTETQKPVTFPQLWHTTGGSESSAGVRQNGLRVGDGSGDGDHFGTGIYLSTDKAAADRYFDGHHFPQDRAEHQFTAQARVTNPFRVDAEPDARDGTKLLINRMAEEGLAERGEKLSPQEITKRLRAAGYDSVYVHQPVMDDFYGDDVGGSQLVVFDANDVEVTPNIGNGENRLPKKPGSAGSEAKVGTASVSKPKTAAPEAPPEDRPEGENEFRASLMKQTVADLQAKMRERGLKPGRKRKSELVDALVADEMGHGGGRSQGKPAGRPAAGRSSAWQTALKDEKAFAASSAIGQSKARLVLDRKIRTRDSVRVEHSAVAYGSDERAGNINYVSINAAVRGRRGGVDPAASEELKRTVADLDLLISASPLRSNIITYRGLRSTATAIPGWRADGDNTGLEWTAEGYQSTTGDVNVAREFATGQMLGGANAPTPTVARVLVPRGTPALQMSPVVSEVLLPRNRRFRVVADNGVVDGVRQVDIEMIAETPDD